MEGISLEISVKEILKYVKVITETESVRLPDAGGRILAEDRIASFDHPPFDRSPIDGYACRSEDLKHASEQQPVELRVTEEIDAGMFSERTVKSGEAVRIMTGAAIPPGCDCCVRQEDTDYGEERVRIYTASDRWNNYCFRGEDFKRGTVLLKKGTRLGFAEITVLAAMGDAEVPVYRLPGIALLTTGDEVVDPGKPLLPGKIYNSNQTLLFSRLIEFGVRPVYAESLPDDVPTVAETLRRIAPEADLIITTGAVSVGKKDIMHEVLDRIGAKRIFRKIKMKPGMPTLFSVYRGVPVLSLSGNPFGVAVTTEMLVRPVLQKMMQDESLQLIRVKGIMAQTFENTGRVRRFVRALLKDGKFYLPEGLHSNGVIVSLAGCNCLIDVRPDEGPLTEGREAEAVLL